MNGRCLAAALLLCLAAPAQEADHRVGTYNVVNSFEFGYRSVFAAGNRDMYRSTINYNNGVRLFHSLLRVNSRDGQGRFADEIVLTTLGTGGDPYQSNSLRLEKNRLYRFDLGFRIVNYHNQLLALSGGQHRFNTERILQNYDLTLFPQSRLQFLFGFDRNNWNGPALTTENINVREPAFPRERFFVFASRVRRLNNTWRLGTNLTAGGLKFSFLQGWDYYKDDTTHSPAPDETSLGTAPLPGLTPVGFRRSDPVHGRTPFSRLNVYTDANRTFALNARLVYAGGERNFVLDENIANLNPISNVLVTRQTFVLGKGERTQASGDLTLAYQPGERWTLSNTTSLQQTRITGDSAFVEVRTPVAPLDPGRDDYSFTFLGIRHITNSTDANLRLGNTAGLFGGYRYSIRRLQSREGFAEAGSPGFTGELYSFENAMHSGVGGIRLRPIGPLTMLLDVEYGRAGQPFTPISERRFHAETARLQWRSRSWLVGSSFRYYRNRNNPPPVLSVLDGLAANHAQQSRRYSVNLAWTPPRRFTFDAGYSKLDLDTASAIINFPVPGGPVVPGRQSRYLSNLHHLHGTLRLEVVRRLTVFLGYSLIKDTAGGIARPEFDDGLAPAYPNFSFSNGTDLLNVYPLNYQSPQARLSFLVRPKLSWNAGWQYYGYSERFTGVQNYFANLLITSLRWAF